MSLLARQSTRSSIPTLTMGLVVLSFLVVSTKYIAPMLYYISERLAGRPLEDVPVMWDFWWPVYLLVAAQIYYHARRAWLLFLCMAVARVLWGAVVLTLFFARPEWDFWGLQWLLYEVVAVGCMVGGIALALSPAGRQELIVRSRGVTIPA